MFSHFDTIPACDRQTPRHPASHVAVAKTALTYTLRGQKDATICKNIMLRLFIHYVHASYVLTINKHCFTSGVTVCNEMLYRKLNKTLF